MKIGYIREANVTRGVSPHGDSVVTSQRATMATRVVRDAPPGIVK
jgi:hypothetical protein